jgi:large subunit ribosomal protein L22
MEAKAIAKYVRMSPRKVGIVLDLIRNKNVKDAYAILQYTPKDAAVVVDKLLKSAAANAENTKDMDAASLYVAEAYACAGPTLKRFQPHAQGRAFQIKKRSSHITIVVKERA